MSRAPWDGSLGSLIGIPVIEAAALPPGRVVLSLHPRPEVRIPVGGQPEFRRIVEHRIAMNRVKDGMRQDLADLLDAFAARWGIER